MTTSPAEILRPNSPAIRLASVVERIGSQVIAQHGADPESIMLTGITHDSRSVVPGDVYAALAGAHHHGADFMADVVSKGAVAVITDPAGADRAIASGLPTVVVGDVRKVLGNASAIVYGDPSRELTMFGITGTNGKTTTAYLLEAAMRSCRRAPGLIGTIETLINGSTIASVRTTPEATDLHALLAVMRERGVDTVIMEVSSHALVMGRVDGVMFDVVGFTNLSQDHLDFHRTMEAYFEAKASLFTPDRARSGVVMLGDRSALPWGHRLVDLATIPVVAVGSSGSGSESLTPEPGVPTATFGPILASEDEQSTQLISDAGEFTVRTALLGSWNLENAVLAAVMAGQAGADVETAIAGIAAVTTIPGRLERVVSTTGSFGVRGFVDYAHTPDAVETVLSDLRVTAAEGRRLVAVIGCGGDRDQSKRSLMGAAAARHADFVIVTDDNPRSENAGSIREAVLAGARSGASEASIMDVGERRRAIEAAVTLASPDGVVAVLGKGHETGQEVAGVITPFDDRLVLQNALDAAATR